MPRAFPDLDYMQVVFDGGVEEKVELGIAMCVEHADVTLDMQG